MRIVFTDSGLGGLSVMAYAYELIKNKKNIGPVDLIFVHGLPKKWRGYNKGYNTMPDEKTKIEVFNRVLQGINKNLNPDYIAVACNTLSIFADETPFAKNYPDKLINVVDIGISKITEKLKEIQGKLIILGTETTINKSGIHKKKLLKDQILSDTDILTIACPGDLTDEIETNPEGTKLTEILGKLIQNNKKELEKWFAKKVYIYLGCTHYGFISNIIKNCFENIGLNNIEICDPNLGMAKLIIEKIQAANNQEKNQKGSIKQRVYAQSELSKEQIEGLTNLLENEFSESAKALRNYTLDKNLY